MWYVLYVCACVCMCVHVCLCVCVCTCVYHSYAFLPACGAFTTQARQLRRRGHAQDPVKQADTGVPRESEAVSRFHHYATRFGVLTGPSVFDHIKQPFSLQSQVDDQATRGILEGVVVVLH